MESFVRFTKHNKANNEIFCKLSTLVSGSLSSIKLLKSAKNDKLEEFKWGLMRTNRLPILKEIINYLVYHQKITIE